MPTAGENNGQKVELSEKNAFYIKFIDEHADVVLNTVFYTKKRCLMNKYEKLAEENQHFWESLDLGEKAGSTKSFAAIAEEDDYLEELTVEAILI